MTHGGMLKIGRIAGTHGVRGEMTVLPLTDDPRRFSALESVSIIEESGEELGSRRVEGVRYFKDRVIIRLEGISDMDAAMRLKSKFLAVDRDHAVKLPRDSYFICDIIGCAVRDEGGETLGVISDVLQTGANDIYVIARSGLRDLLVPAIKSVVLGVDLEERRVTVRLPDGILDL